MRKLSCLLAVCLWACSSDESGSSSNADSDSTVSLDVVSDTVSDSAVGDSEDVPELEEPITIFLSENSADPIVLGAQYDSGAGMAIVQTPSGEAWGVVSKIVFWEADGSFVEYALDPEWRPHRLTYSDGTVVVFKDYTATTVDVASTDPEGVVRIEEDVELPASAATLAALVAEHGTNLNNFMPSTQEKMGSAVCDAVNTTAGRALIDLAAHSINLASCGVSTAATVAVPNQFTAFVSASACVSFIVNIISAIFPNDERSTRAIFAAGNAAAVDLYSDVMVSGAPPSPMTVMGLIGNMLGILKEQCAHVDRITDEEIADVEQPFYTQACGPEQVNSDGVEVQTVYWYARAGGIGELVEMCQPGQTCMDHSCGCGIPDSGSFESCNSTYCEQHYSYCGDLPVCNSEGQCDCRVAFDAVCGDGNVSTCRNQPFFEEHCDPGAPENDWNPEMCSGRALCSAGTCRCEVPISTDCECTPGTGGAECAPQTTCNADCICEPIFNDPPDAGHDADAVDEEVAESTCFIDVPSDQVDCRCQPWPEGAPDAIHNAQWVIYGPESVIERLRIRNVITAALGIESEAVREVDFLCHIRQARNIEVADSPNLENLDGLAGVTTLEGEGWGRLIDISGADSLVSLDGIKNITSVRDIETDNCQYCFSGSPLLASLEAFYLLPPVRRVSMAPGNTLMDVINFPLGLATEEFGFSGGRSLTFAGQTTAVISVGSVTNTTITFSDLSTSNGLSVVGSYDGGDALTRVSASQLRTVNGDLVIRYWQDLDAIEFGSLETVTGNLILSDLPGTTSLPNFGSLRSVGSIRLDRSGISDLTNFAPNLVSCYDPLSYVGAEGITYEMAQTFAERVSASCD